MSDLQAWRKSYLVTVEERDLLLLVLGFANLRRIFREVFSTFSSSSLNSKTSNFLVEEEEDDDDRLRRVMKRVSKSDSDRWRKLSAKGRKIQMAVRLMKCYAFYI